MDFTRFGLSHAPFLDGAGTAAYVATPSREAALTRLLDSLEAGRGLAVVTSSPGQGKTLLCRELARRAETRFRTALLPDAAFRTRRHLLQAILFELGEPYTGLTEQESRLALLDALRSATDGRTALILIIDEAHLLSVKLLEELRALSNHEAAGTPLIRILLAGNLELEERLIDPALEAINQRIVCHETLDPLSQEESAQLIDGRIMQAGGDGWEHVFSREAMELICLVSDGSPRNLEHLAGRSLQRAAKRREQLVSRESVEGALAELRELPLQWYEPSRLEADLSSEIQMESGLSNTSDEWPSPAEDAIEWPSDLSSSDESAAVLEVGAAFPVPAAGDEDELETLFLRGSSTANVHDEEPESCSLDDTAILDADEVDLDDGCTSSFSPAPAYARKPVSPPMHKPAPQWIEEEVQDRYALLDKLRADPAANVSLDALPPRVARPAMVEILREDRLELDLLEAAHTLSAEIRRESSCESPFAGERRSSATTPSWLVDMPEWDVIQPDWVTDEIAAPSERSQTASAAKPEPAIEVEPVATQPGERLRIQVEAETAATRKPATAAREPREERAPVTAALRVDPGGQRRYSQLFSRLRRLRSKAGAREAAGSAYDAD